MEAKLKHLEFIQGIIDRMAKCSFMLKGWCITLVVGLYVFSSTVSEKTSLILISFIPIIVFWILDAYYLWQERLFREVYDYVRKKPVGNIDFKMNPMDFSNGKNTWFATFKSKTILWFYLPLIITLAIAIFAYFTFEALKVVMQCF